MAKAWAAAAAAALVVGGCTSLPPQFSAGSGSGAQTDAGEAFGVEVGSAREASRDALLSDQPAFRYASTTCRPPAARAATVIARSFDALKCAGLTTDEYRAGMGLLSYAYIAVESAQGRVVRIRWGRSDGRVEF